MARNEPYNPVPTVQPTTAGTPKVVERFPEVQITNAVSKALSIVGNATGVYGDAVQQVGQSYAKTGRDLEGAGDELYKRAYANRIMELEDNVDKQKQAFVMQNTKDWEEFYANPNPGTEGLQATLKKTAENREKMEKSLKSEWEQRAFRKSTMDIFTSDARSGMRDAGIKQRKHLLDGSEANIKLLTQQLGKRDLTAEDKKTLTDELHDEVYKRWTHLKGAGSAETDVKWNEANDDAISNSLMTQSEHDPAGALKRWGEEHILEPKKNDQVYKSLVDKATYSGVISITNDILQKNPNIGEADYVRQSENAAVKYAQETLGLTGDAVLRMRQDASTTATTKWHRQKNEIEDTNNTNMNNILTVIHGKNPTGKKLFTMDDLIAVMGKDIQGVIENMPDRMREHILDSLVHEERDEPPTPQAREEYSQLHAALNGALGSAKRAEALTVDPHSLHMPIDWKKDLLTLQEKVNKAGRDAAANPQIEEANTIALDRNLVPKKILDKSKKEYGPWIGSVIVGLRNAVAAKGEKLTKDEIADVIRSVTKQHLNPATGQPFSAKSGYGGKALYQLTPNVGDLKRAMEANPGMSKQEVIEKYQEYWQKGYLKDLEKADREGKGATTAPTPKPTAPSLTNPTLPSTLSGGTQ